MAHATEVVKIKAIWDRPTEELVVLPMYERRRVLLAAPEGVAFAVLAPKPEPTRRREARVDELKRHGPERMRLMARNETPRLPGDKPASAVSACCKLGPLPAATLTEAFPRCAH